LIGDQSKSIFGLEMAIDSILVVLLSSW